jgi:DNA primase
LIEEAEGFFDYYLKRLGRLHDVATDKGRFAVLRGMAEAVQKTSNAVLTDTYAQKTALQLGVSPEAARAEFKRLVAPTRRAAVRSAEGESEVAARPNAQEVWLLRLLFLNENFPSWLGSNLDLKWVEHPGVRQIVSSRLRANADGNWQGVAAMLADLEDDALRELVTEVTTNERPVPKPEQQLHDVALRLRNQFLDRELAALVRQASRPETTDAMRLELIRKQQELRQAKLTPLAAI